LGTQTQAHVSFVVIAAVLGFIMPWFYWSLAITHWRLWAFENVRNVHELKNRAIKKKLIWKDGSFFETTEIRTALQKDHWIRLLEKFNKQDIFLSLETKNCINK
jgi:hypothetical protein